MKLFQLKHIIIRFLDGKLSPEEESELFNQKSVVSRMKQQWDSQSGDISTFDQERVLRQIESKINRASAISRRRAILSFVASIAASILLVTGIGYYLFHSEQHPVMTPQKRWFVKR